MLVAFTILAVALVALLRAFSSGLRGLDAAAAAARYRELREEHYGTGAYDFSPLMLTTVAERLAAERQEIDGAILVVAAADGPLP